MEEDIAILLKQIQDKEDEIQVLRDRLNKICGKEHSAGLEVVPTPYPQQSSCSQPRTKLDNASIARYSRQLILPELGVQGQLALSNASVLVVGAGGLGCPSAIYLAAAGIGKLGLVDHDEVELSNLHRQVLHTEARVGEPKAASAAKACTQLNSSVTCVPYHLALDSTNALKIIKEYDIVVDATDNVATRYLLNDACVIAKKPLVSGSALRFEGQLTVYSYLDGPCYRCLYPSPPPPETVTNCSDGGVLGVIPGIIGSIQALEAIKIATGIGSTYSRKLLLFDGLNASFRTIKLRPRQPGCVVCGDSPSITQLIDYEQFCGAKATDKDKSVMILEACDRISVVEYKEILDQDQHHLLVDVRQPVELQICQLPHSTNIPLDKLDHEDTITSLKDDIRKQAAVLPVYVVCRRGNDSQLAVLKLKDKLKDVPVSVKDVRGGLTAWAKHIDNSFPVY